ncbi:NnrS family protein [Propionivibrio sp.]|uniref:NnrS family protein n=1 Tax=Propionivibrio sp. TaxID=2212460 RepID=UPI003BF10228
MKISNHPLWLVGFRPFFALVCLSGLSLPILWVLIFSGTMVAPTTSLSPNQWHAHEMFFGFGWPGALIRSVGPPPTVMREHALQGS